MKTVILFAAAFALHAQTLSTVPRYSAIKESNLTATAEKVTVQCPLTGCVANVGFEYADVYCSVACEITLQQNGSAASTTAMTAGICGSNPCTSGIVPVNGSPNSTTQAYSASNVGTGSVLKSYYIPAGQVISLDLRQFSLAKNSLAASNLSIGTNAITGTARIQIQWTEQ